MAVTTWEEALKDLTPQEVWALRKIRMHLRRFLLSEGVEYRTRKPRFEDGYGGLDRVMFPAGGGQQVMLADLKNHAALDALFLALDETIYSYGEELLKVDDDERTNSNLDQTI
jgi:hypothetical protein